MQNLTRPTKIVRNGRKWYVLCSDPKCTANLFCLDAQPTKRAAKQDVKRGVFPQASDVIPAS
jgi:ribosomal protein L36